MRYAGQGYEITIPCEPEMMSAEGLTRAARILRRSAQAACSAICAPEEPVEIVSYRVRGIGMVPPVEMPRFQKGRARH